MKGLFNRTLGATIKGASIIGGVYLGFVEGDWALGTILGATGYTIGTLFGNLGYEVSLEKRAIEIGKIYQEEAKKLERKGKQLEANYKEKEKKLESNYNNKEKKLEEIAKRILIS